MESRLTDDTGFEKDFDTLSYEHAKWKQHAYDIKSISGLTHASASDSMMLSYMVVNLDRPLFCLVLPRVQFMYLYFSVFI